MVESEYILAVRQLAKKYHLKIRKKNENLAKKIIRRWNHTWSFVGRKTELKKTKKGVFFYISLNHDGEWFRLANLSFRVDQNSHFCIQAPSPKRGFWKDQKLANTLDFLAGEWSALEFALGEGKKSILVPLDEIQKEKDVDFIIEDLLEVSQ